MVNGNKLKLGLLNSTDQVCDVQTCHKLIIVQWSFNYYSYHNILSPLYNINHNLFNRGYQILMFFFSNVQKSFKRCFRWSMSKDI